MSNDLNKYAKQCFFFGQKLLKLKKFNHAIRNFTKAITLNPDLIEGYQLRAEAYKLIGNINASLEDLKKASTLEHLYQMKEKEIIKYSSNLSLDYYLNNEIYQNIENIDESIHLLRVGIEIYPDEFQLHLILAKIYLEQETSLEKARVEFEIAFNLTLEKKDKALILFNYSNYFKIKKNWQMQINCYSQAIDLNDSCPEYFIARADAMLNSNYKNYDKIYEDILSAIELNNQNASYFNKMGNVLHRQNQLQQADIYLKKAIELEPQNFKFYQDLIKNHQQNNKISLFYYSKYLDNVDITDLTNFKNIIETYFLIGNTYIQSEQYDLAIKNYSLAIQMVSKYSDADFNQNDFFAKILNKRSFSHKMLNQTNLALSDCKDAIEYYKIDSVKNYRNISYSLYFMGEIYESMQNVQLAVESYKESLKYKDVIYNQWSENKINQLEKNGLSTLSK